MKLSAAKELLRLRDQFVSDDGKEAEVTAFITALLANSGLLFTKFKPQTLSRTRGFGTNASEYDFASSVVALEVKPASCKRIKLENALDQARGYAARDRQFIKGLAIATNGYAYVWQAIYCPTKEKTLVSRTSAQYGDLKTAEDIMMFAKLLDPSEPEIDRHLATQFQARHLITTLVSSCSGTQTKLWNEILDYLGTSEGSTRRMQTIAIRRLRTLSASLRDHETFRNTQDARALRLALASPETSRHLPRLLRNAYGRDFPAELAAINCLRDLKTLTKGAK